MIDAARTFERGPVSVRPGGYGVAVIVNAALAFLVNAWPGWEAVPFLTEDTPQVLPLVNLPLAAGVIANIVYLANDAPWAKAVGDLVTNGIGLVVLVQVWRVFPFEFSSGPFDWQILVRVLLALGIVGTAIGLVDQSVTLVRRHVDLGGRV